MIAQVTGCGQGWMSQLMENSWGALLLAASHTLQPQLWRKAPLLAKEARNGAAQAGL